MKHIPHLLFILAISSASSFSLADRSPGKSLLSPLAQASATRQTAVSAGDITVQDPQRWSIPFYPQGIRDWITSFEVHGDSVLVTGNIGSRADSIRMWGAALWDGKKWVSPVTKPPSVTGRFTTSLSHDGKRMFIGGHHSRENLSDTSVLATWDGKGWGLKEIPAGGFAISMVVWEGEILYASVADGLWKLTDSSTEIFRSFQDGMYFGLTVKNDQLWVRGGLRETGGGAKHGFAVLEGGTWTYPGIPTTAGLDWAWLGQKAFLVATKSEMFYPYLDSVFALTWDGVNWNRIALDASVGSPRRLASDGTDLYLMGTDKIEIHDTRGPVDVGMRISKWDGNRFVLVERQEFQGKVSQATWDKGRLFVAGEFDFVGDLRADNLAMWDGAKWHSFSQGVNPGLTRNASAFHAWNGKLVFAGQNISVAGPLAVSGIAAWDGAAWSGLGKGIRVRETSIDLGPGFYPDKRRDVVSLASGKSALYAGGVFDTAGNGAARNIAMWDGQDWYPLAGGVPNGVREMAASDSLLFVINVMDTILRWDGRSWSTLGRMPESASSGISIHKGDLWMGVDSGLAKWTGVGWDTLKLNIKFANRLFSHGNALYINVHQDALYKFEGGNLTAILRAEYVESMAFEGDGLIVSGLFDLPGYPGTTLARWDGTSWFPMADLGTHDVLMAVHGEYLYLSVAESWNGSVNFDPYLRWNLKNGTWSRPHVKKSAARKAVWSAIPCARDCFFFEGSLGGKVYDVHGRSVPLGRNRGGNAAGVRVTQ